MGGSSPERPVSLYTGCHACAALISRGYDVTALDWTDGRPLASLLREARIGRVWLALHGTLGEDGSVQGLLECERIPYTGSSVLASALGIDKIASKRLFDGLHIATPAWTVYRAESDVEPLGFPLIVKPSRQGSSVGLSLVSHARELAAAVDAARRFSADALVEQYVPGRELSVGVLDDAVLGTVEIKARNGLFDFDAKYNTRTNSTEYIVPAPLDPATEAAVTDLALSAHRALGCSGLSRIDVRLRDDGRPFVLEVNTLPGCGSLSLVTKMARHAGLSYEDLVERVLRGARLHTWRFFDSGAEKANGQVKHRTGEEKTVETIQNAAMTRNEIAEVLDASASFQRRECQITEIAAQSDQDGKRRGPGQGNRHQRPENDRTGQTGDDSCKRSLEGLLRADRLEPRPPAEKLSAHLRKSILEHDDEIEEDCLSRVGFPQIGQDQREYRRDEDREQRRRNALQGVGRLAQEHRQGEQREQCRGEDPETDLGARSVQDERGGCGIRDVLIRARPLRSDPSGEQLAAGEDRDHGEGRAEPPAAQPEQDQERVNDGVVHTELEPEAIPRLRRQPPHTAKDHERHRDDHERGAQAQDNFPEHRHIERHCIEGTPSRREPHPLQDASPETARGNTEPIVDAYDAAALPESVVGGKAKALGRLVELGFPVPPWFCVTTSVYQRALGDLEAGLAATLAGVDFSDRAAVRAAATQIQAEIRARRLAREDKQELLERFDATFEAGSWVAVRSSAVGEDSACDSFAGQMESFLFVRRTDVADRVLACFASAYSERALIYRQARRRSNAGVRVAVIVQKMIDSHVSGILFTRDPTAVASTQAMVSAAFGLGEGIVSGAVESDTFLVDPASGTVTTRNIREKSSRVVFDAASGHGTRIESVEAREQRTSTLTLEEVIAIVETGRRLERVFEAPQDVEWAVDGRGAFFLLQTRPITTIAANGRETIFDNANIVESFPGLSLPLTFSFFRAAYELVLVQASRRYGVSEEVLTANRRALHANLVALIRGRIYYNLGNWYRLIEILPGCEWMLPGWEEALGIAPLSKRPAAKHSLSRGLAVAFSRLRVAGRFLSELLALDRDVEHAVSLVRAATSDLRARDLATLGAHELLELSELLMRRLFEPYAVQNSNDDAAQQFFALLGRLMRRWSLGGDDLRNDLISGERGMESVEPVRSLLNLTAAVQKDARLSSLLEGSQSDAVVWQSLERDPEPAFGNFRRLAARHIELYADRVLCELKLETPTLEDNPSMLIAMIRNQLRAGARPDVLEGRKRESREQAEAAIAERLRSHPLRRRVFGFVLSQARRTIKNREALRLARSRAIGLFKRIYRQIGQRFADQKLIGAAQDIFYLTVDEIEGAIRGGNVVDDLHDLVALRKRDYEQYETEAPASRIATRGIVRGASFLDAQDSANASLRCESEDCGEDTLRGIGCASGKVSARVMVVHDPTDDLDACGRILVTRTTDPGWVFLMVTAAGLVSEKGSPLSHTAIIGRELGVPTIVGVEGATRRIVNGQRVEIDGRSGTVRRLVNQD